MEITPPVAILSRLKIQRRMLLVESGYFKWHFFTNSNSMWVHPLNERNAFGEYHHLFRELKRHPMKFFAYWRMSIDTFEYILSKVRDRLEKQTSKLEEAHWCRRETGSDYKVM